MRFISRDLSEKFISSSYQDVLQQYLPSDTLYVLDGFGNVVFTIPSSSIGNILITSDITSSMTVASASYANTYNVINQITQSLQTTHSLTSDSASYSDVAALSYESLNSVNSIYSDTASLSLFSNFSTTASYALNGGGGGPGTTASYALTSSYSIFSGNNGLSIPNYDYSNITYNGPGGQFSNVIYKFGGISGSLVCTLTAIYSGSIFTGVSKSLS